jgi:hypothetical protein
MGTTSRRKRFITAVFMLLVLGAVGLVYAAWTTNGTGSGYAQAGQSQALSTIDVSASVTTLPNKLYPGTDGDVLVQVHNPNPYPVRVTQIAANGAVTAAGGTGTCTTTGVSLTTPQTVTIDAAANANSAVTTLTNAAHMSNASQDGCQTATFTIPVSLTGASNAP